MTTPKGGVPKTVGHSDHAQVNALPAQAYLQDVMPPRQQRGCRCQRPHESAALPHFLVLPIAIERDKFHGEWNYTVSPRR